MRDSILDSGNRLIIECNRTFRSSESHPIRPGIREKFWKGRQLILWSIQALMQRDWLVKVCHVPREENAAADKLVALGKGCGLDGRIFVVPPGAVASIVEHDQRRWMEERSREAMVAVVERDSS
ncbi:hypothetical protein V6N11_000633 [Hibiscus sabdariffa]|uniref:RNase H type-1 domain-containing protein n=2 Tax=Hibiscus sabdariffa TaxID=183260 RepID=A0ABR2B799_9ROSI